MTRKAMSITSIPEDFQLTEKTVARVERDYPTVDVKKTLAKFILQAEAKGWMYKSWQAAFVNYVDNGEKYGGVFYKQGVWVDPKWAPIIAEAQQYGFRAPGPEDPTPGSYRTNFERWKSVEKRSAPIIEFGSALKRMGA